MTNKIIVGNLSAETSGAEVVHLLSRAAVVQELSLVTDKITGQSRGIVVVSSEIEAEACVAQFNNLVFNGQTLSVSIARRLNVFPS